MAAGLELLLGAVFEGHIQPAEGERCELVYKFSSTAMELPLPAAVRRQWQAMRWSCKTDIRSVTAECSIPSFGLESEEVVVSIDLPAADGSRRMMLQSLKNPDLGVTVLRLEPDGKHLVGGDESWEQGAPPLIRANRKEAIPKKQFSPSKRGSSTSRQPTSRDNHPGHDPKQEMPELPIPREPSPDPARVPVGCWASPALDDVHKPVVGGIGRSVMGVAQRDPLGKLQATGRGTPTFSRPDLATGDLQRFSPEALDENIRAAEAEAIERLVSAATLGEMGDMRQLLARLSPDCAARTGRHEGLTPLIAAVRRDRVDAISLLLERRATVNGKDSGGWTVLMHAIQSQRPGVVSNLLKAKASVHAVAEADGQLTPLMLAAAGPRTELCTMLLKAGAPKEARDAQGQKAVHIAAKRGHGGALVSLIAAGARVNDSDAEGLTPLLVAATSGRAECVKLLLANRADLTAKDPEGRTAIGLASMYEHDRVLAALASADR